MLSLTQATKTIAGLLSLSKAWYGAMGVDSHHRAFYSSHNAVFSPPRTITTKPHQPPIAVTVRPSVIYLMTKTRVVSSAGFDCVKWLWITGNKWKALYPGITNAWFQVDQRHAWLKDEHVLSLALFTSRNFSQRCRFCKEIYWKSQLTCMLHII